MSTTIKKAPDQDLYDLMFAASTGKGYATYQHNPPASAAYPFVQIGFVQLVPMTTKSWLLGHLFVQADVWGSKIQRKAVSDMAHDLMAAFTAIKTLSSGLKIDAQYEGCTTEVMPDTSGNEDLWRARLSLEFTLF